MTGRPCARFGVLAAGLTVAATLVVNHATADPTESSPPHPPTETSAATSTATTSTTAADEAPPAPPAIPEPPPAPVAAQRPQLEVTATFDKPAYRSGDQVGFTFSIANVGGTPAVGLQVTQFFSEPTDMQIDIPPGWGPLGASPGVTVEPGASFQVAVTGNLRSLDADRVVVRGFVQDAVPGNGSHQFSFSAPVTRVLATVAGTVFGDQNGNGVFDNGEALAGITLTLRYAHGAGTDKYTATSGADGKFSFPQIPTARYILGGDVVMGWLIPFDLLEVDGSSEQENLLVRAVPPLNGALSATMAFTKDSYRPGELAQVTVTLTNSGPIPLTGIVAACNRAGFFDRSLSGTGPGWGDLAGDGVTIPAGQTRTFDVSENVPDGTIHVGRVYVGCDFGYREVDIENHATANDSALVPGGVATLVGDVLFFPEGHGPGKPQQGIAGVRVVLVDERECPIVGERTTDANGHFEFHNLAPGPDYVVYFLPPQGWKIKFENPTSADVRGPADQPARLVIEVEPGDGQLPAVPTQPAGCTTTSTPAATSTTPAPQARSSSGLASTGANVSWLSGLGLIALLLGAGVVSTARRRRTS